MLKKIDKRKIEKEMRKLKLNFRFNLFSNTKGIVGGARFEISYGIWPSLIIEGHSGQKFNPAWIPFKEILSEYWGTKPFCRYFCPNLQLGSQMVNLVYEWAGNDLELRWGMLTQLAAERDISGLERAS